MSCEPRRARGSAPRWAACWPAVAVLGLLGGFATPDTRAAIFGSPSSIAVSQPVVAVAMCDVNHDGKPDLIAASNGFASGQENEGVFVILSKKGGFGSPTFWGLKNGISHPILALAVADLNGDGHPDIVTANTYSGDGSFGLPPQIIYVLLNDGNGNFG
jgi:hypothetical protein